MAWLILFGLVDALLRAQTSIPAPVVPNVVSNVRNINTGELLDVMNHGSPNFVPVAAHRGLWVNFPENSAPALRAAYDAGIEAIEVDLRTTADGVVVVSHDADLVKETTGTGYVNQTFWSTIAGLKLRDRKGNVQDLQMLRFVDALNILAEYNNGSQGPLLICDVKGDDQWNTYLAAVHIVQSTLPTSTQQAVLFKVPAKNIPSIGALQTEASDHPSMGHIVLVVYRDDNTGPWGPTTSNFQAALSLSQNSPHFVQQIELNIQNINDGGSTYLFPSGPLQPFAVYSQSDFYPEGVSTIQNNNTLCCFLPNIATDKRGVLSFGMYYQNAPPYVSIVTTDGVVDALNYLGANGLRDVRAIQ